ncbi:MAG: glycosyltransferase [Proteobacteria bacterium]|nr:glycosyltransferase [Pseudomonadota bacterium]MBU1057803.1 glycosyltransferase [Pseudomonadota bacterium]
MLSKKNFFSKILWYIEKRCFDRADIIIVDTDTNGSFYSELFKINKIKFRQLPLCIDQNLFHCSKESKNTKPLKILFAGGFIPLQGVDIIVKAAHLLKKDSTLKFYLIGDGQEANCIAEYITTYNLDITWIKEWLSIGDLAKEYNSADICLGIFGRSDKRGRVWPFKNYNAMATGIPVISSNFEDPSLPRLEEYYYSVSPASPRELAKAILLLKNKEKRQELGKKGNIYYSNYLANKNAVNKFYNLAKQLNS